MAIYQRAIALDLNPTSKKFALFGFKVWCYFSIIRVKDDVLKKYNTVNSNTKA